MSLSDVLPTPEELKGYPHIDRLYRRVRLCAAVFDHELERGEEDAGAFGAGMIYPVMKARADPAYAERLNTALGKLFDDGDAGRPLDVADALERVQQQENRWEAFEALLRTVPITLHDARQQAAYVLAMAEAGVPVTLEQCMTLLRAIATPRPIERIDEIMAFDGE